MNRIRWSAPLAVGVASVLAACTAFEERQDEIDAITAAMRSVPGVTRAEPTYVNSTSLGASFGLKVEVDRTISPQRLETAGERFVDEVDDRGFPQYIVTLGVSTSRLNRGPAGGTASFRLTDGATKRNPVTADEVAGDLRLWAEAIEFPGVRSVSLSRPADPARAAGVSDRMLDIYVTDDAAGERLAARFPETSGHWRVAAAPPG